MAIPLRSATPMVEPDRLADPARLRAVRDAGLQDERLPVLDRLVHLLVEVAGVSLATISLVDDVDERLLSSYGVPEPWQSDGVLTVERSFAKWVVANGHPLTVEDARGDPLLRDCEPVLGWGAVSYAGHPIRAAGGLVLGVVAVMDVRPRRWTSGELALLREVAAAIRAELRARAAKSALVAKAAVLDAMMSALGEDVDVLDAGGRVLFSNRRAPASSKAETVVPLACEPRLAESPSSAVVARDRSPAGRALAGERTSQEWFVRDGAHPDGRWCHVAATPVIDAHGQFIGAVVVTSASRYPGHGRSLH